MRPILPLRFETTQTLRETATTSTFVATDHVLGRNNVVVKAIRKGHFTQDRADLVETFAWYRGLRHPHVAAILDAGLTPKGDLFYVRDFALPTQMFATKDTELLKTFLGAMDFLLSVDRVHGAISPSNLLASAKSVQVADPWIPQSSGLALSEEQVRFSAPEVLKGNPRTMESDLYSVGAVLYRFYSGRDLFDDGDLESLISRHIWASPRPLTSISYVSETIGGIVENLIHKDPAQRRPAFETLKNELRISAIASVRSPVYGMTEQLDKAEKLLQENTDRLRILTVEGPVGFGKTRFIEELRHRMAIQAPSLAFSVCPNLGRSADATVAQWFLSLADRYCSSFEDPSVRRLQSLVDSGSGSVTGYSSQRVVHDLVDLLASITQRTPLAMVMEDIDRANRKVARLIGSIVSRAARLRLCVVVTSRTGGMPPSISQTFTDFAGSALQPISLGHLSDQDSKSIASFLERDDDRRAAACKASGGSPLFLDQYCKHQKPGIPQLVKATMSKLVDALPNRLRPIAEVVSLFDGPVSFHVLQQVTGVAGADLEVHLSCLRNMGLSDHRIFIRHSDTRSLLYAGVAKRRKAALHAVCYEHLKDSEVDMPVLARHAYHGALFEVAATLNLELATKELESREFSSAARFYGFVQQCRKRNPAVLPPAIEETIGVARCRAYLGDPVSARATLRSLLLAPAVLADPELLSSAYSASASPFIELSSAERIRLLKLAAECLPSDSLTLAHRKRSIVNALLFAGDVAEAEIALDNLCSHTTDDVGHGECTALRATILAARGRFRDATNSLVHNRFRGFIPSALGTNVAVYLEQLGEIREAVRVQREALQEAKSPVSEIACLRNLSSMETKLGNINVAQNLFERTIAKLERIRRVRPAVFALNACYSDAALHWIERGSYRKAILCIDRFNTAPDGGSHWESFQFYSAQCELHLALGDLDTATKILDKSKSLGRVGGFLDIERLLIQCRLQTPTKDVSDHLLGALETARELETQYQQCRVLIALSRNLLVVGDLSLARATAREALELAQNKGYRLLAAQALLRRGLATENDAQKESDLVRCLEEASDMGLLPLLSECAFHIGARRFTSGDSPSARDYFFKSVSITSRMAGDLDSVSRRRFCLLPLHQEARRFLREATTRTRELMAVLKEPLGKADALVGGLYRLTSALSSAQKLKSKVSLLTHSLSQAISQTGVVIVEHGTELTLQVLEGGAGEELKERAIHALRKGSDKIYFTELGRKSGSGSAVWVPIPSLGAKGGIYIECGTGHALDEQDIQYLTISAAIAGTALDREWSQNTLSPPLASTFAGFVGISEAVRKVHMEIEIAAKNSATVLIEGESGVGKELVAQAIHSKSLRARAPFVPVDCGALPDGLIESELFGTRKGSFTGAAEDRPGLFEEADGGTIFLDEIANASLAFQAKLLRVLQEREIRRVGDNKRKRIDARVVAATNCNLERLVEQGRFRQDILFRLKVLHIQLPPLRERKEDIPLLANTFLHRLNRFNDTEKRFGATTISSLLMHDFPGNVRELQNAIEVAYYRCDNGVIGEIELHKPSLATQYADDETQNWFLEFKDGQRDFWSAVRDRYKRRDISRERVLALVDFGLRSTRGNYKAVASMFKIKDAEYRRFMDFLRRNDCLLDFRPYRRIERRV